jgi:hypothetical protein
MSGDVVTGSAGYPNLQLMLRNKSPSRSDLKSTSEFRERQLQVWHR